MRDHPIERQALGELLKELRHRAGMPGRQIATILDWSQPQVSRVESGGRLPNREQLDHYLAAVEASSTDVAEAYRLHAVINEKPGPMDRTELAGIGARYAECRKKAHLNQGQVSELSGVPRFTVTQFEIGASGTTITKFRALCAAVGADANYVLGLSTDPPERDDYLLEAVRRAAVVEVLADLQEHLQNVLLNVNDSTKET